MDILLTALKAASDQTRLRILALLSYGELTVSEIVEVLDQSQPRVSRHLKLLCDAGLLSRFQEGAWVFYRLDRMGKFDPLLSPIVDWLKDVDADELLEADKEGLLKIRERRSSVAQEYFRDNVASWNEIRSLYVDEQDVEKALLYMLPETSGQRLLDVGTGTGRMLELFGTSVAGGLGLDINREMLSFARTRLTEAGLSNCQVQEGDMYALPVEQNSQDIVIFHQVLHYADDPMRAIAEAARTLSKVGRLLIVDFAPHGHEDLREKAQHRRLGFSDAEMQQYAQHCGLTLTGQNRLKGGKLDVVLWRFEPEAAPNFSDEISLNIQKGIGS